jgi:RNA recognition motif-containing protein
MNIFLGNLSFEAKDEDVYGLFMPFGSVINVSIVMDKKGLKSRGFGFLEMPDEQQAKAAIAALNKKEFMGRPINVELAYPKTEADKKRIISGRIKPEVNLETDDHPQEKNSRKADWFKPSSRKAGPYKTGRRTRSFLKKRAQAGLTEEVPPKTKNKVNPMRWPKKQSQSKPWRKKQEGPKSEGTGFGGYKKRGKQHK